MINLAEIVNPCLQLVIFSLLTMDYDGKFNINLLVIIVISTYNLGMIGIHMRPTKPSIHST